MSALIEYGILVVFIAILTVAGLGAMTMDDGEFPLLLGGIAIAVVGGVPTVVGSVAAVRKVAELIQRKRRSRQLRILEEQRFAAEQIEAEKNRVPRLLKSLELTPIGQASRSFFEDCAAFESEFRGLKAPREREVIHVRGTVLECLEASLASEQIDDAETVSELMATLDQGRRLIDEARAAARENDRKKVISSTKALSNQLSRMGIRRA